MRRKNELGEKEGGRNGGKERIGKMVENRQKYREEGAGTMKKPIQMYYDPKDEMFRTLKTARNKTWLLEVCYKFAVEFYRQQTGVGDPDAEEVIYYLIAMLYLLKQGKSIPEILEGGNGRSELASAVRGVQELGDIRKFGTAEESSAAEKRIDTKKNGGVEREGKNEGGGENRGESRGESGREDGSYDFKSTEGILAQNNPALASVMADIEIQ